MKVKIQTTTNPPPIRKGRPRESDKYQYHNLKQGEEVRLECDSEEEANKVRMSIENSTRREVKQGLINGKFIVKQSGNIVTCYRVA